MDSSVCPLQNHLNLAMPLTEGHHSFMTVPFFQGPQVLLPASLWAQVWEWSGVLTPGKCTTPSAFLTPSYIFINVLFIHKPCLSVHVSHRDPNTLNKELNIHISFTVIITY